MQKVLIIIDEQYDFTSGVLGNAECEATVQEVVNLVNTGDYNQVILTRDTHDDNYLNTQEGRRLPVPHTKKGTEGWKIRSEIIDALNKQPCQTKFIDKHTFGSSMLGDYLVKRYGSEQNDVQIDFCGVDTGICVLGNVVIAKTALPEATVRVIAKACACATPDSNNTALKAMEMLQVDVVK